MSTKMGFDSPIPPGDAVVRPLPAGGTMLKLHRRLTDAEERAHACRLYAHGCGVYMYATDARILHEEAWMLAQSSSLLSCLLYTSDAADDP